MIDYASFFGHGGAAKGRISGAMRVKQRRTAAKPLRDRSREASLRLLSVNRRKARKPFGNEYDPYFSRADLIYCAEILHYIEDLPGVLREFARMQK
jgi:hypothetical protein